MAQLNATDTVAIQLEAVSPELPLLVEMESVLDRRIQDNGKSEMVSTRNYRIPMQTGLPGAYGMVSLDGGDFPRGGEPTFDVGQVTPMASVVPLEFSELAKLTGSGGNVSTIDVVAKSISQCMEVLKLKRDKELQTDGTGKLATVAAAYAGAGANPITLATSPFGARLVDKGQKVGVFNGNALRNSCTILDIGNGLGGTQSITVDAVPGGTIAGDFIRVDGVANGAPVSFNGIANIISTSTAGNIFGIARANSYVVAQGVNAASSSFTLPMFRLAKNQILQKLGQEALKGLVVHTHTSQLAVYENLGFNIQTMPLQNGKGAAFDPFEAPTAMDKVEIIPNIHADNTRVDLLNLGVWGKVKWGKGTFWYEVEGMGRMFPIPAAAGGGWSSGIICFLLDTKQYYANNLVCQGGITGLLLPAGY